MKQLLNKSLPFFYGSCFNLISLVSKKKAAHMAFETFCTVRKGKVLPQQQEFLKQALKSRETVCGHSLQTYHWPGSGERVLLLHGWESNSFRWRNLIAHLRKAGYDILAFDAPGHGYSSGNRLHVPLYAECLQYMVRKFEPVSLVAHSVGGMTALYHEYQYPDSGLKKIVTIGSPSEFHEIMAHYCELLSLSGRVKRALEGYIQRHFGFEIRDFSTSRFVAGINKKGLLFHDRLDRVAPVHASLQVHAHWEGSNLILTEGLGHSMHQDVVNEQIVTFLGT